MALLIYVFLLMSLVAAAFSRQVQWWVLRCESSQCLGVYERWRAWACLRSEYGGERCKVNSGSFDTALCHEEWVGQEKEWNCREGCSSLGPRLNWQVKALSSWWGCCFFSDSSPIRVNRLWIFYFCKAYLFPPLKECTRHTDDVLGNAWSSTSAFVCREFLVGMP